MDTAYWNDIAANYEDEIFNVYANDQAGVLADVVASCARKRGVAADFGCGIGNGIQLLAQHFSAIEAFDYSSGNIQRCREKYSAMEKASFARLDLAKTRLLRSRYDFGICVSVLIMPSITTRKKIAASIAGSIKSGAYLLVVVPSMESACYINSKTVDWNLKKGMTPAAAVRSGFDREPQISTTDFRQGLLPIEGVRTKHYVREELLNLFDKKMIVESVSKIEYGWHCVFDGLPKSLASPLPWDWCLLVRRC